MSFPRYAKYKDSGVEWLGEVPETWEMTRLRFVAQINPSKSEAGSLGRETEVSFIPMEAVSDNGKIDLERTRPIGEVATGYTYFRDGDVAFAKITPCFENGKGAVMNGLLGGVGFGTTELIVARPKPDKSTSNYLHWLFSSCPFRKLGEGAMYGAGGQKRVPDEYVRNFSVAFPDILEQHTIAAFLDRETAKIDALVAEQGRLIALLAEKRQAVISHAVTKGLNPDAPMKDSGIAWLGEVPEHWMLKRLKHISPFIAVGIVVNPSEYVSEEGRPFLYGGDIHEGWIDWQNSRRITDENSRKNSKTLLQKGDLLTVRVGAPGITAVVPEECEGGNCASVMLVRRGNYLSDWLCYSMNSRATRYQVEVVQYGAAQEQFNISHAVNFWIPTPPPDEQQAIVAYLADEAARLDALTEEAQRGIELLKERRAALISAAVTGKIDVRGFGTKEQ